MNKGRTGSSELNETPSVSNIYCTSACCASGTRDNMQNSERKRGKNGRRRIMTSKVPYSVKNFENTKA